MDIAPTVLGFLDSSQESPVIRVHCPSCREWHAHPTTADMRPGDLTHVMPRCDDPRGQYRSTGYYIRISRRPYLLMA